ncbi:MAG TPA: DUF6056 family protein [Bacteroidia bacterium]|nr:DUF6056 family protein [Bacteroidia bacterium]
MINTNKKNLYFLVFLALLSFLPYFFLSLYANPAGDDFVYAYNGKHFELFENAARDYFQWTGRYVSNFLFVLNPMAFDSFTGYKFFAILLILLTSVSFYFLTKAITNNAVQKKYLVLFSGVLTLLYLNRMPSLAQGIYWYTGAVIYHGANVVTLFYFSFLIFLFREKYFINKTIHVFICLLLILIITGFNETIMIFLLLFHVFLFAKNKNRLSLLLFIFSCLCASMVIFSPGNAVREAAFPERHQLFHSLLFSVAQTFRFFGAWINNIPLTIASLLYIPLTIYLSQKYDVFKNSFYLSPLLSTCSLFLVVFLSAFPAYWSTGILGQHRTVNVAYFFFLILWFINLTVWLNYFSTKKFIITLSVFSSRYFLALFTSMILFSFITGNGYVVMNDLFSERAKNFDNEMKLRYETLNNAQQRSDSICILDTLQNKPVSLFVLDISPDENDWMNRGMAAYFGINKVTLRKQDGDGGNRTKRK